VDRAADIPRAPELPEQLDPGEVARLAHDALTTFLEAQLESVSFRDCDLQRADFRDARLKRCEFRRSDLNGAEGIANLRGSAMEWPDIVNMAGVWAAALGIETLDSE
jgi:uncharacterized protein YjbI with pentapeptide repeats